MNMHASGILTIVLVLVLGVLGTGCTSEIVSGFLETPTPAPTLNTAPVTVPTTVAVTMTTAAPLPTTERVRTLPAERKVNLVLTKDRPSSEIHLLYQGGPGEIYINRVMMRVYTSETMYTEYIMSQGRKPIPGDEIIAPGTRSGDRCEVFVISAGARYKIMDEAVYGGMYY